MHSTCGERIYAIGDVHGMDTALAEVHAWIAEDMARTVGRQHHIIHIGDYCDRGPATPDVIERLIALERAEVKTTFLLGNHDRMLLRYAQNQGWQDPKLYQGLHYLHARLGGRETLASYGVDIPQTVREEDAARYHQDALSAIPDHHFEFLSRCILTQQTGDYLFVHAGIHPEVPLNEQVEQDLLWIRKEFFEHAASLPVTVVHGHTVLERAERVLSRIGIDTGAVFGGALTCLVLDNGEEGLLSAEGISPLPNVSVRN